MPLDPQKVAPGNRIKYNNQESDVVDRLTGESGNKYIILANPQDASAGLRFVSESVVIDDDATEFVSTTAEAKDPERAAKAEADAKQAQDQADYESNRAEFLAWQQSQASAPTNPTVPTNP